MLFLFSKTVTAGHAVPTEDARGFFRPFVRVVLNLAFKKLTAGRAMQTELAALDLSPITWSVGVKD